jgi:hypothetical protein
MIYGVRLPVPVINYGLESWDFYMGKWESLVLLGLSLRRLHDNVRRTEKQEEGEEELVNQILFIRKLTLYIHWI